MSESTLAVTAGSGSLLRVVNRTISSNTVKSQYVIPDDGDLATYRAIASNISIATANDHILQLMAGSSLNLRIHYIRIEQATTATTATIATFSIYRLTTAGTGGTTVTPAKLDNADSAAGAAGMTLPSSKGTESTLLDITRMPMRQAVSTLGGAEDIYDWKQAPGRKPIIVAAGTSNGIAIKSATAVAAATVDIIIEFTETSY